VINVVPITLAPNAARATPKKATVRLDEIDFPANARPTHADKVRELAQSIRRLGLQTLPTVVERDGRFKLVTGRHRIEAYRVLKRDLIDVRVVDFDDVEARLWTISENLHRNELSPLDRGKQILEWIKLTEEKSAQADPVSADGAPQDAQLARPGLPEAAQDDPVSHADIQTAQAAQPDRRYEQRGISKAARELGTTRDEVRRGIKIGGITPEAEEAARAAGLDRNQSDLLKIASYRDEDQLEVVADIVKARAEKAQAPRAAEPVKSLRNLENLAAGELARWIKLTTPNDRMRVIRMLRDCAALLEDELQAGHAA
jgi:ParB family transcriptional regulator, chromosome partitioning protein